MVKILLQRGQPGSHGAVIDITPNLDSHSSDQRRVLPKGRLQSRSVFLHQTGLHFRLYIWRQPARALDFGGVPRAVQRNQPPKMRKRDVVTARPRRRDPPHDAPRAVFVQHPFSQTKTIQLCGFALGLFAAFHWAKILFGDNLRRFLIQPSMVFRRQNLSSHVCRRLNHKPANLALQVRQHSRMILLGCFVRL
jgi:hypothetical protein